MPPRLLQNFQRIPLDTALRRELDNALIECHQLAFVASRQSQEIGVGNLLVALQALSIDGESGYGNIVAPES